MPVIFFAMLVLASFLVIGCLAEVITAAPLDISQPVRGWTILSDSLEGGIEVIRAAHRYDINHLQLSHHIIHNLRDVRDPHRRDLVWTFTREAHANGIQEVAVWDHTLYPLDYYPNEFKSGPGGTIDFDNPAFWTWFKNDYREMLDMVPEIQGIILTFIETGARAENQYSEKWPTTQQKLAAVVNAVADVVIGERDLNLYARTFSYDEKEYENIIGAVALFQRPEIRLMMKETPHDFFLTHPTDRYAGTLPRPTIMEFDTAGEFNGQGLIANTWPQYILRRWSDVVQRDQVIGYVARTDRYKNSRMIGRPNEINLFALKRYSEDPSVNADQVYREFIVARYGEQAYTYIRAAFENAYDIVTASLYTLGTNVANHSKMNFDPYSSSYARHVSGKWVHPPVVKIQHDVNKELHYWKDIIEHIAPRWAKAGGAQLSEIPDVVEAGWLTGAEQMNEEYLHYIITQKDHAVLLAEKSLNHIHDAKPYLEEKNYEQLAHHFTHTLLTVKMYRAAASAYWGFRVWARDGGHRSSYVTTVTREGLIEMRNLAHQIHDYDVKPSPGQWNWVEDADTADQYWRWIVEEGWPSETKSFDTGLQGQRFPM